MFKSQDLLSCAGEPARPAASSPSMPTDQPMPAPLLIAIDGSSRAEALLALAVRQALALAAPVEVICVIDPGYSLGNPDRHPISAEEAVDYPGPAHEQEGAEHVVKAAVQRLQRAGVTACGHVVSGEPEQVICRQAHELGCQLIVLGHRHRRWLARVREASVCHAVIEQAACPVLVLPPHDDGG